MDHDDELELDDDGKPRRKRVFRSGDTLAFKMEWQDHIPMTDMAPRASGVTPMVSDGLGNLAGHRPGYCFVTDDSARQKADEQYLAMKQRQRDAYKKKRAPQPWLKTRSKGGAYSVPRPHDGSDENAHDDGHRSTLDELQRARDAAWRARNERASNAWRQNR
jgi:hypothetical protein